MTADKPKRPHPNRTPFEGVLTRLDEPSDKAPSGSHAHRVILTKDAAVEALDTLIHMAVDFKPGWDGHDARQKCGVITEAWIEGSELLVRGFLYCRDFPEIAKYVATDVKLGMSYELADAHVKDMRSAIWTLTKVTFTGAAILLRQKAAYGQTRFTINASDEAIRDAAEKFTGCISFITPSIKTGRAGRSSTPR